MAGAVSTGLRPVPGAIAAQAQGAPAAAQRTSAKTQPPAQAPAAPAAPAGGPQAPANINATAPRLTPVSGKKRDIASSLRKLAAQMDADHPEMDTGMHLRDAARVLDSGQTQGAIRHLQTAAHALTPQSLYRHGVLTDDGHTAARRHTYHVTAHILRIRDVQDTEARNLAKIGHTNTESSTAQSGSAPQPLVRSDPSATSGPSGPSAVNAPAGPLPTGGSRGVAGAPATPPQAVSRQWAASNWGDVLAAVELSAQTARLAVTPAPRGRPGGPGLYDVKGMGHTAYLQNVVKALIRKRGMDPHRAYAIARGSIRRWAVKSKHGEVRAAAGAAEAGELARQARAKSSHGHAADSWAEVIELVGQACR